MKRLVWGFLKLLGKVLGSVLGGIQVEGQENVPKKGSVLIVPNHLCDIDAPIVWVTLPRRAWYMAMRELFSIRILGPFLRFMQAFPVSRDSADRSALRFAETKLKEGEAVVVFPEGRGNPEGVMAPFQPGAALIALRTQATVIPVGIIGTHGMLPYGTARPKRAPRPVQIRYGKPISYDDLKDKPRHEALDELTHRMGAAVALLAEQPLPASQQPESLSKPITVAASSAQS